MLLKTGNTKWKKVWFVIMISLGLMSLYACARKAPTPIPLKGDKKASEAGSGKTSGGKGKKYPLCTSNGGKGYGDPWKEEGSGLVLAKNKSDFTEICEVDPNGTSAGKEGDNKGATSGKDGKSAAKSDDDKKTTGDSDKKYPICTGNGGNGYGDPWKEEETGLILAKNKEDFTEICEVDPNAQPPEKTDDEATEGSSSGFDNDSAGADNDKYPLCTGNGGKGYGAPWKEEGTGLILAKNKDDYTEICRVDPNA
jgi:dsDNA-binding SOS-regulon protein